LNIQDIIIQVLLKDRNKNKISELPIKDSLPTSSFIYNFLQSDFNNQKYDCFLAIKKLNDYEFVTVRSFTTLIEKNKRKDISIFLDEDYNDEILLYTEEHYIDSDYSTEEEYLEKKLHFNNTKHYPTKLFQQTEVLLCSDKQYADLGRISDVIKTLPEHTLITDLFNIIESNNLIREYRLLTEYLFTSKVPKLNKHSFFNKEINIKNLQDIINDNPIINGQDEINRIMKNGKGIYNTLVREISLLSRFIKPTNDQQNINALNNNNIQYTISTYEDFIKFVNEESRPCFSEGNSYLKQYGLDLSIDNHPNDKICIYGKNAFNEVAGVMVIAESKIYIGDDLNKFNSQFYYVNSISTNIKFRGQGISSHIYKLALDYANNKGFGIIEGSPTKDNLLYINRKIKSLSENSNTFIIDCEDNSFHMFSKLVGINNIPFNNINELKPHYKKFNKFYQNNKYDIDTLINFFNQTIKNTQTTNKSKTLIPENPSKWINEKKNNNND